MHHLWAMTLIPVASVVTYWLIAYKFISKLRSFWWLSNLHLKLFIWILSPVWDSNEAFISNSTLTKLNLGSSLWILVLHSLFPQTITAPSILLHNIHAPIVSSHVPFSLVFTLKWKTQTWSCQPSPQIPSLASDCSYFEAQDPNTGWMALY